MVENESRSSVSSDWSRLAWIRELVQELKDQMREEKLFSKTLLPTALRNKMLAIRNSLYEKSGGKEMDVFLADMIVAEMIEIADGEADRGYNIEEEPVTRSKLRIETRKWLAERLAPALYGMKAAGAAAKTAAGKMKTMVYLPENDRT